MRAPGRPVAEGDLLWTPSAARAGSSRMRAYMDWLASARGLSFSTQDELWRWSVTDLDAFWRSVWEHCGVISSAGPGRTLGRRAMPGTEWFPEARLNYAENALGRHAENSIAPRGENSIAPRGENSIAPRDEALAIIARSEDGSERRLTRGELAREVQRVAGALRALGVSRGDRVAAFLPNSSEAVIAFLAAASLGATWSSCSPEFGVQSVLDRFAQIAPKVLIACDGYRHGGRAHDRRAELARIREGLPSLAATILVRRLGADVPGTIDWESLEGSGPLVFEQVPFDHPLWILYSSGTTGLPKPIVQGHGGILLEHLKALQLHCDVGEGDRFFWFTTTGWMMWNFLVSGLLVGATILLYDGSPGHPDLDILWRFAEESEMTCFGTSAPYLLACMKAGLVPRERHDLSRLRSVGSTGAPLPPEGFAWVYENVSEDLMLGSVSGGTDACTAFVLCSPLLPVHAGEIQCRGLGAKVEAFDESGASVVGQVGELVITEPLPSMPLCFWNDADGSRLAESYFAAWPGVWRHGDWIKITERGSCVISGRSDSTLNRAGVRMGTSEFYRVVEAIPEIADSLVVDTGSLGAEDRLWLFVVPRAGTRLDDDLLARLKGTIRRELSPRHVPDEIRAVEAIPRTINGKKLEIPVKKILLGMPAEKAASRDTLANPASLDAFIDIARGA